MADSMGISSGSMGDIRARQVQWPRGEKPVEGIKSTPVTGPTREGVGAGEAVGLPTAPTTTGAPAAGTTGAPAFTPINRAYTLEDLASLLRSLNLPDTQENLNLASLLSRGGMEITRETFIKLSTLLEGNTSDPFFQEAALILLAKGVESREAVQILSRFLAENPQLAQQLMNLQSGIADLRTALNVTRLNIDTNMVSLIGALISQSEELLDGLQQKFQTNNSLGINRDQLLMDIRALKAMLEGVKNGKLPQDSSEVALLSKTLESVVGDMRGAIDNLVAQTLLSQSQQKNPLGKNDYSYYQIPNAFANPPQNVEILVQRDASNGGKTIDPRNTQIVLSFDTQNMGKVGVVMTVKDKRVGFMFSAQNDEFRRLIADNVRELSSALTQKEYRATPINYKIKPEESIIREYLLPDFSLDILKKIDMKV